jgi:KaiC/GvpD/RAD55 family RecA-like ATPase
LKPGERVPREILSLLDGQGVFFLIKGGAGSGKTSLALELLRYYRDRNGIYLSTRVSPQKFYKHFPWVKEAVKPECIIDVTKSYEGEAGSEFSSFESLGVVFQFFEEFYERARRLKDPVIVVDSWEGVAKRMAEKERMKTENALAALIEKANANLIFISEEPQQTVLDYLADGVVVLNRRELEEELPFHSRIVREIEIQKARGTTIKQSKYLFTLNGGRFQFFEPLRMEFPIKPVKPEPLPDSNDRVSTGIEDFDRLLDGGYQKGSFNLLEIEHGVGTAYNHLIFPTIVNFLNQTRGVVILPSEGTTAKTFYDGISPFTENFEKCARVIERGSMEEKETRPYVISVVKGKTYGEIGRSMHMEWIKTIRRLEKETNGKPVLGVLGLDALEYEQELSEIEKEIAIGVSSIKDSDNVVIGIARRGQELIDELSQISSTHFKVRNVDGAVVMYGVVPRTEIYNVSVDVSKGYGRVRLTPIV